MTRKTLESGAQGVVTTLLDDDANLERVTRGVLVSAEGTLRVTLTDETEGDYVEIPLAPNVVHPLFIKRLWSTNTTLTADQIFLFD